MDRQRVAAGRQSVRDMRTDPPLSRAVINATLAAVMTAFSLADAGANFMRLHLGAENRNGGFADCRARVTTWSSSLHRLPIPLPISRPSGKSPTVFCGVVRSPAGSYDAT